MAKHAYYRANFYDVVASIIYDTDYRNGTSSFDFARLMVL